MRLTALLLAAAASVTVAQTASAQTNTTTSSTTTTQQTAPVAGQPVNPTTAAPPPASVGTAPPQAMTPGMAMPPGSTMAPGAAPAPTGAAFRPITPAPGADIVSVLQASGQFTILLKAVEATGLTPVLKTTPGITVFAPTDTAFSALPPAALDLKDPANLQKLQALLTYHVINAKVPPLKGHSATPVTTVANKPVTLDGSGDTVKVNDATALQPPVTVANNSVIYPIDKVLSPDYVPPPAPAAEAAPADDTKTTTTKSTTTKKSKKKS